MRKFFVIVSILFILIPSYARNLKIENPYFERNPRTYRLSLDAVELNDSSTILEFTLINKQGYWASLDSTVTFLKGRNTGKSYKIIGTEKFPLNEKVIMPEEGMQNFKVLFEPLSDSDTIIDFKEEGGFIIEGINLSSDHSDLLKTNISGVVEDPDIDCFIVMESSDDFRVADKIYTIPVVNGRFDKDIYSDSPRLYEVIKLYEILKGSWMPVQFFSQGGNINLYFSENANNKGEIVSGNPLTEDYYAYLDEKNIFFKNLYDNHPDILRYRELSDSRLNLSKEAREIEDSLKIADEEQRVGLLKRQSMLWKDNKFYSEEGIKARTLYEQAIDSVNSLLMGWVSEKIKNPSMIGLAEIYDNVKSNGRQVDKYIKIFENNYKDSFINHPYHMFLSELLKNNEPMPGNKFIDFRAPDLQNRFIPLSLLINEKVAVIDLWASWCGPCRKHSIELIPLYDKYKDKGFTVVGVARENENTDAMRKVIEHDGYPWINLVDLNDNINVWAKYRVGNAGGRLIVVNETGTIVSVDPEVSEIEAYLEQKFSY